MKCPKCSYLGFETGDRCRNCGYDFSLLGLADGADSEAQVMPRSRTAPAPVAWGEQLHEPAGTRPLPARRVAADGDDPLDRALDMGRAGVLMPSADGGGLPLFAPAFGDEDDVPLVKLPPAPRPPVAVRRGIEPARTRATSQIELPPEPVLSFGDDLLTAPVAADVQPDSSGGTSGSTVAAPALRRVAAASVDLAILAGIDVAVLYFTLRMASLGMADWSLLPRAPLLVFLLLLKFGYVCACTVFGGQTIGMMAVHIQVVRRDGAPVEAGRAAARTVACGVSAGVCGLGFLPALFGPEHLALHDRVTQTRVIDRPA